jgi:glycosyltransferase involved in cell wall biosynthesis
VGRLVQEKGLIELFEAFRALAPSRPWLKLLLVGEADLAKPDAVRVEEHLPPELLARVIQAGWQKQVEDFYPLMDLFTLPSHREGFPRTLMEACAMGLPVVATDIRGCREAVTHDDNGLLVPARAPQDLARALAAILDDPALAARLAASARQRAAREFDEREKFKLIYAAYARDLGLRAPS